MGSITISAVTSAGNVSKAFPVTDANILRLAAFARSTVAPSPDPPTLTNAQALEQWMRWALEMSKAHVAEYERRQTALPDFGIG